MTRTNDYDRGEGELHNKTDLVIMSTNQHKKVLWGRKGHGVVMSLCKHVLDPERKTDGIAKALNTRLCSLLRHSCDLVERLSDQHNLMMPDQAC